MAMESAGDFAEIAAVLRGNVKPGTGERLYGVVDAAQDCELAFEAVTGFGKVIRSLFQGEAAPALAHVTPYLVPIDPESGYLQNWAARLGKRAGILLLTSANDDALYLHLRNMFVVQDEKGQEYFFRFYDPRVLRQYVPTCTPDEIRTFFGPVRVIAAEGSKAGTLTKYTTGPAGVAEATIILPSIEPVAAAASTP
jgi:hypothetical protein